MLRITVGLTLARTAVASATQRAEACGCFAPTTTVTPVVQAGGPNMGVQVWLLGKGRGIEPTWTAGSARQTRLRHRLRRPVRPAPPRPDPLRHRE